MTTGSEKVELFSENSRMIYLITLIFSFNFKQLIIVLIQLVILLT